MKYSTIKKHLQPYIIVTRRKTTINHAFAAAVAPHDNYDDGRIREAILKLGQDPELALNCVYCGKPAETWDHVFATVKNSEFSGQGHRLGNLLPCCKQCNSSKGSKNWQIYLKLRMPIDCDERIRKIAAYLDLFNVQDELLKNSKDYEELMSLRNQVLDLLSHADLIAKKIRSTPIDIKVPNAATRAAMQEADELIQAHNKRTNVVPAITGIDWMLQQPLQTGGEAGLSSVSRLQERIKGD